MFLKYKISSVFTSCVFKYKLNVNRPGQIKKRKFLELKKVILKKVKSISYQLKPLVKFY